LECLFCAWKFRLAIEEAAEKGVFIMTWRLSVILVVVALVGCSGGSDKSSVSDTLDGSDTRDDSAPADSQIEADIDRDVPPTDGAGTDGEAEVAPDVSQDLPPDAPPDLPPDAPPDLPPDAPPDLLPDTRPDAEPEADTHVEPQCVDDDGCRHVDLPVGPCEKVSCDMLDGVCKVGPVDDSTPCDDGDACTTWDSCRNGVCVGDYPVVCDPPTACRAPGVCNPSTGDCDYAALVDGDPCTDGNPCTDDDACLGGVCTPAATRTCNDHDPCTTDTCSSTGCVFTAVPGCVPELDCTNGGDDNDNGRIDCDDPHCVDDPACALRPAGDLCRTAHLVNDGNPVTIAHKSQTLTYTGDTTGATNDYWCRGDLGAPDEVWRLELGATLVVTATVDFTGDPGAHPWGVISLYPDPCWPLDVVACETGDMGTEDVATFSLTLKPGVYFVVVDGLALDDGDQGPYAISFSFAAPPADETNCADGLDEDGDGGTDCGDPDCNLDPGCPECPIEADLKCGDTASGTLVEASQVHYYTFSTPTATNVRVVTQTYPNHRDQMTLNYSYGPFEAHLGECYGDYHVNDMWHTPDGDYFTTKAGREYQLKTVMAESTYLNGTYSFTIYCNDGGPENVCNDGDDNDADSWTDCDDSDCFADAACTGGKSGETCADAFLVNGGEALTLAGVGTGLSFGLVNTTAGKDNQIEASCAATSFLGPDLVYRFTLADTLEVSAFVEPRDDPWGGPALYVFGEQCSTNGLVACGETYVSFGLGFAALGAVLPPGTYHLVVDSGATGFDGKPDAGLYQLDLSFAPPPTPEICGNDLDDEGDDLVDCRDPECFDWPECTGGHTGEACDAIPLKAEPLVTGDSVTTWNTTINRANDASGACSSFTAQCPDLAHGFALTADAVVTATVTFDNGFAPALLLYPAGNCTAVAQIACQASSWDSFVTMTRTLPAGSYVLVVDGADSLTGWLLGPPAASTYELRVSVSAP